MRNGASATRLIYEVDPRERAGSGYQPVDADGSIMAADESIAEVAPFTLRASVNESKISIMT